MGEKRIKVYVYRSGDRGNYRMKYQDPINGGWVQRSTGTADKSEAETAGDDWEYELNHGLYSEPDRMPWEVFRDYYEEHCLANKKPATAANDRSALVTFERLMRPQSIGDLSTARMTAFTAKLREPYEVTRVTRLRGGKKKERKITKTRSVASIARHLRHLRAAANWAHKQEKLSKVPHFDIPGKAAGAKRAKGRPITTEEFERMLGAAPKVVTNDKLFPNVTAKVVASWETLLWGLWWSGLRLGESLSLTWESRPGGVTVDLGAGTVTFDGEAQKSGRDQECELAPEAVDFLRPMKRRAGYVFSPLRKNGEPFARDKQRIGRIIAAIGKAAGVVVNPKTGKTASAHDLRRSFGDRCSERVEAVELMRLMRHESIETTATFYATRPAKKAAASLRERFGSSLGSTPSKKKHTPEDSNLQPSDS